LPSWVDECVDEETLMNEDGESARRGGSGMHKIGEDSDDDDDDDDCPLFRAVGMV
jgi:hypothetical protein